jgi:enamine deaminase RidA (YjgF/YER057c/UK114 family)
LLNSNFRRIVPRRIFSRFVLFVTGFVLVLSFLSNPLPAKKKKKPDPEEGMTLEVSTKQKKKKGDEDLTQTLPLSREAPSAVTGATDRLIFQTSPMSAKGLLSQQTRDALRSLIHTTHGLPLIKLRAFVSGSGDMRRVQEIMGEIFNEKHLALPALSVVQVGALPMEGAQVIIEAIAEDKKQVNPKGLAFISGQPAASVEQSLVKLENALRATGMEPADTLRATCFLSSIEESRTARTAMGTVFPGAALNFVQMQREPVAPAAECEAVARLRSPASSAVNFLNPPGLDPSPNYSQVVQVTTPRLVFTSTQLGFGKQESDVKLAFERLRRALASANARFDNLAMSHVYLTVPTMGERVRAVRSGFYNSSKPPASTLLPFEGLPSLDASFGVDVVAIPDVTTSAARMPAARLAGP